MKPLLLSAWCLWLLPLPAGTAQETPRDHLLRLVPDDVGVCLVINDLRSHGEKLLRSPWLKKVRETPLGKALANAPELLKLSKLDEQLKKHLNVTWAQLRDDILGDAIVLAYRPGPPGKPEQEHGVLLLYARKPELLAKLVERFNHEQKKTGELKDLQVREHKGLKYHRRVEADGDNFYALQGPVLALTAHEPMLRQVLERQLEPKTAAKPLPLVRQMQTAGVDKALGTLWINPRAFDAELQHQAGHLPAPEAAVLKTFLTYWKAVEGITLSMLLERDPEFVFSVQARTAALPAPAQRLVAESAKPSELWRRFPQKSVMTLATRTDVPALLETLGSFLTPEARQELEDMLERALGVAVREQLVKQVLPYLGPDCGLCVLSPPAKKSFPHILVALRVQAGTGKVPVDQALMKTLHFFIGLAVVDQNLRYKDQPTQIKTMTQDNVEVRYLVNDKKFPAGFQPSFALKDGYLLLASSPDAIRRFIAGPVEPLPAGKETLLLRVSLAELSTLLKDRRESIVGFLAEKKQLPPEAAGQLLDSFLGGLDLFDNLELSQRTESDRVIWIARLRTAASKK